MPQVGTELKNALGTGRVRETRRADQKQGLPLGRTAALQAPRGIPRIPPGSAAGEAISGYRRNYRRRLRLRGVACSVSKSNSFPPSSLHAVTYFHASMSRTLSLLSL